MVGAVILGLALVSFYRGSLMEGLLLTLFGGLCCLPMYQKFEEKKLLRAVITQRAPGVSTAPAPAAPQPLRSDMPVIIIRHADTLPAPAWNVNACSASTNAAGNPPTPILYL